MEKYSNLNKRDIYAIPSGQYFGHAPERCLLVYSPLANVFFLATPDQVESLESLAATGEIPSSDSIEGRTLAALMKKMTPSSAPVNEDTFCTLHILLNERCNFNCKYCYSAGGRSSAELNMSQVETMLNYFLSRERSAVKDRTVMFMGGGEPVLSWDKLVQSTLLAEKIAKENGIELFLSLTTNGSIMTDEMLAFLKDHDFMVQVSFEILPDVQDAQRGMSKRVAENVVRLTKSGVKHYLRSTITEANVDRIPEMVAYCQEHFPKCTKLSCQQVVDPEYFATPEIAEQFFDRYLTSFNKGVTIAAKTGLQLRSSSSHLINYSMRQKFCYNLVCLTPYGTITTCPDVSSPQEKDYPEMVCGEVKENNVIFDKEAVERLTNGSIHTIPECQNCWARWNCGSGCPSSRRVYRKEILEQTCIFYKKMLHQCLIERLAEKHEEKTGRDFYKDMASKL